MGAGEFSVAAATAVVDYDLATSKIWKKADYDRRLIGFALSGSAASNDTIVQVFIGSQFIGEFYNKATGAVLNEHLAAVEADWPAEAEIFIKVTDAPATNAINGRVEWDE